MTTIRKTARGLFVLALLATGFSVATPANAAPALNQTPCGNRTDLLHVWGHISGRPIIVGGNGPFEVCYANGGAAVLGDNAWIDQVSTGNNNIIMHDANGDDIGISRWTVRTYPHNPPHIQAISIV